MRPGQNNNNNNNKRMRGRPTNNRRGPNPLTRSYESNGPDVKIRGNAHHVAEKYLQLARDAHTSGDPVAAENYLQHAEHYFRLSASAQAAQLQAQIGGRPPGEVDYDEDDEDDVLADRFASPSERVPPPPPLPAYVPQQPQYAPQPQFAPQPPISAAPQPYMGGDRQPFDGERPPQPERNNYRNDRQQGRNPNRGDRPFNDRQDGPREGRGNDNRNREFRPYREANVPRPEPQPVIEGPAALPSFITSAPRLILPIEESQPPMTAPVVIEAAAPQPQPAPAPQPQPAAPEAMEEAPEPQAEAAAGEARFPRGRRRRLRSPYGFHAAGHPEEGQPPDVAPEETPASE